MSKAIKTILIILVSLAVVFASIFIFGKLLGAELRFHSENYEVVKETSYDIDNIDILNLQFKSADVNIKLSYDDQIKITEYSNKKNKVFTEKLTKETISVIDDNDSFCIGACLKSSTYYDISLPMDYKGDLKVETTSGNIFIIDTINVGSIDLSSNSGDIKITSNIPAGNVAISSISGDINIYSLTSDYINIKNSSGDIDLVLVDCPNTNINSTSGDISINNLTGNIKSSTASGDVEIEYFDMKSNSDISTTSGDVDINLGENAVRVNCQTTSGEIEVMHNNMSSNLELKIFTTSGDIEVK